jgi:dihydrolipoamide dehydrogenase
MPPSAASSTATAQAAFDVVVIGSGPGGYVAAIRAGQLGLRTAIVEKDTRFGGTCLLRGCIPTKALLESAETIDRAHEAAEFGISISGAVSVDMAGVHKRKDKVVQQNAGGVAFLLKKNKVQTFAGHGRIAGAGAVTVTNATGEVTRLETKNVVLATGSAPRRLPNIAVDGRRVLTSDELLELKEIPSHLLVLGAGAVGVEFASVFKSFGAQVTVVELMERLVPVEDDEVGAEFEKVFRRRGIGVHTGTKVVSVEVTDDAVRAVLENAKGEKSQITASHLLVAVGRRPVTEDCGLDTTNIELDRGFIHVDGLQRTSQPGVYAIGDIVAGKPQLAHAASAEGILAMEHIAGLNPTPIDWTQCPGATYSHPRDRQPRSHRARGAQARLRRQGRQVPVPGHRQGQDPQQHRRFREDRRRRGLPRPDPRSAHHRSPGHGSHLRGGAAVAQRIHRRRARAHHPRTPDAVRGHRRGGTRHARPRDSSLTSFDPERPKRHVMAVGTFLEALREALMEEMEDDERVFLLGEDIATYGGAFKLTQGFAERFGAGRVIDTPIAEGGIIGAAIGAALMGLRPVAEMQFLDFISCGFDQLTNFAAKVHYRWGQPVPIVVRGPGGAAGGGPFHSQSVEMYFIKTPGIKVVEPSTAADAKLLLKAAIRDPNPVLFIEHKGLYRAPALREELPDRAAVGELGRAAIRRDGDRPRHHHLRRHGA